MPKPTETTAEPTDQAAANRDAVFNATMQQRIVQDLGAARLAMIETGVQFEILQHDLARKTAECEATATELAAAREEIKVLKGL